MRGTKLGEIVCVYYLIHFEKFETYYLDFFSLEEWNTRTNHYNFENENLYQAT